MKEVGGLRLIFELWLLCFRFLIQNSMFMLKVVVIWVIVMKKKNFQKSWFILFFDELVVQVVDGLDVAFVVVQCGDFLMDVGEVDVDVVIEVCQWMVQVLF